MSYDEPMQCPDCQVPAIEVEKYGLCRSCHEKHDDRLTNIALAEIRKAKPLLDTTMPIADVLAPVRKALSVVYGRSKLYKDHEQELRTFLTHPRVTAFVKQCLFQGKEPCLEWPNCECPQCTSYRTTKENP